MAQACICGLSVHVPAGSGSLERMFHAVDLDVFAHLGQPHGSHDRTWVHAMAERERWRQPWLAELKRQAEHEASFVQ